MSIAVRVTSVEAYGLGKPSWRERQHRAERWRGQRQQGRTAAARPCVIAAALGERAPRRRAPPPHLSSP
eukprot:4949723-Prymnesium_polylepis.1